MSYSTPETAEFGAVGQQELETALGELGVRRADTNIEGGQIHVCPELPIVPHNFQPISDDDAAEYLHAFSNGSFHYAFGFMLERSSLTPLQVCEFLCEHQGSGLVAKNWATILDNHLHLYSDGRGLSVSQMLSGMGGGTYAGVLHYYDKEIIPTAKDMLVIGAGGVVLVAREMFPEADLAAAWQQVIATGDAAAAINALQHEQGGPVPMDDKIAELVAHARYDQNTHSTFLNQLHKFSPEAFTADILEAYLDNYPSGFMTLYSRSSATIPWVERCIARLGYDLPHECLRAARDILHGEPAAPVPDEWRELGITQRGEAGFLQLQEAQRSIRSRFMDGRLAGNKLEDFVHLVTSNRLAESFAQQIVRFGDANWGGTSHADWRRILRAYTEAAPTIPALGAEFEPSRVYTVGRLDESLFDPNNIDEGAMKRYLDLTRAISRAMEIVRVGGVFNRELLATSVRERAEFVVRELEKAGMAPVSPSLPVRGISAMIPRLPRLKSKPLYRQPAVWCGTTPSAICWSTANPSEP